MVSTQRCFIALIILLSTSAILLIVSSVTPRWLHTTCGSLVHDYALWYITICAGDMCETLSYTKLHQERLLQVHPEPPDQQNNGEAKYIAKDLRLSKHQMIDTEIELTISVVLHCLALGLVAIFLHREKRYSTNPQQRKRQKSIYLYLACFVVICTAVTLIIVAFSRFASINLTLSSIYKIHTYHNCTISTPYSLIVLGTAGSVAILAAMVSSVVICTLLTRRCKDDVTNDATCDANGDATTTGQQLVTLIPTEEAHTSSGYVNPAKPGYALLCTHAYTST